MGRRCGGAAVAIAVLLALPELFGIPGCGIAAAQTVSAQREWRWSITPYAWGSSINADVTFPGGQQVGGEVQFGNLVDKIDYGAMVHFEGQRGSWGMLVDVTYMKLGDDATRGPISANTDIELGIYEFAATYTPGGGRNPFTAIVGARIIDLSLDMTFSVPALGASTRRSQDGSATDFMVGGRFTYPFNDRWFFNLRADIGTGDTKSDWNALAGFGWRFSRDLGDAVLLAWRHMELEVDKSGRNTDVTLDGPLVGVMFSW